MRLYLILSSLLTWNFIVYSQNTIPQLSTCPPSDSLCNTREYTALQDSIVQNIFKDLGYYFNDSIYLEYKLTSEGSIEITDQFVLNLESAAVYGKEYLRQLKRIQSPENTGKKFQMVLLFNLPDSLKNCKEVGEVTTPLQTNLCPGFNEKAQKACVRYLGNMVAYELMNLRKIQGVTEVRLFLHQGQLSAIKFKEFTENTFYNDLIYNTFKRIAPDTVWQGSVKSADDQYIEMEIRQFDDVNPQYYHQSHLDYLGTLANKQPFFEKLIGTMLVYQEEEDRSEYILTQLSKAGYYGRKSFVEHGRTYRIDSIKNYSHYDHKNDDEAPINLGAVEKVPVFEGCDSDDNNSQLQTCFQKKMMYFVMETYKFPEPARMAGIQGKVYIDFVVEKDGHVDFIKVIKGVHPLLDKEAIRTISLVPVMQPAMHKDKPVRMSFTMPFNLKLQ